MHGPAAISPQIEVAADRKGRARPNETVALAILAEADGGRSYPCKTCASRSICDLIDDVLRVMAEKPEQWLHVGLHRLHRVLHEKHGLQTRDAKALVRHIHKCRADLWQRVEEARARLS